jgi:hypothetical protein
MLHEAVGDWQSGELFVVPHAWRDDGLWSEIQASARERITANLQTMYSEFLQQPLSPLLCDIAHKFERRLDAS